MKHLFEIDDVFWNDWDFRDGVLNEFVIDSFRNIRSSEERIVNIDNDPSNHWKGSMLSITRKFLLAKINVDKWDDVTLEYFVSQQTALALSRDNNDVNRLWGADITIVPMISDNVIIARGSRNRALCYWGTNG